VAYVAVALQLRWVLRRAGSFRWWAWALFPVPLLAFDLVFARSLALTVVRRSVTWRGRDVSLTGSRSGEEVA
jgi:4,4'-diaponeurosporenoate glycosyltransferase